VNEVCMVGFVNGGVLIFASLGSEELGDGLCHRTFVQTFEL
jgi:hypothetical protein